MAINPADGYFYEDGSRRLKARNSWGLRNYFKAVTEENFHKAYVIDPEITTCKDGRRVDQDIPRITQRFRDY